MYILFSHKRSIRDVWQGPKVLNTPLLLTQINDKKWISVVFNFQQRREGYKWRVRKERTSKINHQGLRDVYLAGAFIKKFVFSWGVQSIIYGN